MSERTVRPGKRADIALLRRGAKVLTGIFGILALVAVLLEFGAWKQHETHRGPFSIQIPSEPNGLYIGVGNNIPLSCCFQLRSDNGERPTQSDLKLWINGQMMGPAHAPHVDIRRGGTTAFSNWIGNVYFALPAGVPNSAETIAEVQYSIRPPLKVTIALIVSALALFLLTYWKELRTPASWQVKMTAFVLVIPYWILTVTAYLALLASLAYVACTVFAIAAGWALPTTAAIQWSSIGAWAARSEPQFGHVLLMFAGVGAVAGWIAPLVSGAQARGERQELVLFRFFRWWAFLITACIFIISMSAMWSGIIRIGDFHGASIGGLVPFSDAGGYLSGGYDQARDGSWNEFSLRRPLAAAFRTVLLVFGNYSYAQMLLVQALVMAGAMVLAALSIARWRGIWAGLTFYALAYIYCRTFTPTSLTESLGLIWALASIPFLVLALRTGALGPWLLFLATTTLGLMTRLGGMFTIPALMVWIVLQSKPGSRLRAAILVTLVVAGALAFNFILSSLYSSTGNDLGSNFGYTLCGMTIGTDWGGCLKIIEDSHVKFSGPIERQLYEMALSNFVAHPSIFFSRAMSAMVSFVSDFPALSSRGYLETIDEPAWFSRLFVEVIAALGLFLLFCRRRNLASFAFWLLLVASIVLSSSIVFFDDGKRVMAVSYVQLFALVALGFGNLRDDRLPVSESVQRTFLKTGNIGVAIALSLFLLIPWLNHLWWPRIAGVEATAVSDQKLPDRIVFGGRRMTGFLVMPDDVPLRTDLPSIHVAELSKIMDVSGIEKAYQGLIHPEMPALPFGFVFAPRAERGVESGSQYIVPPEVMERREVLAWRFKIEEWHLKPPYGAYWYMVTHAEPVR